MSQKSYRKAVITTSSGHKAAELTLKDVLYISVDELEGILMQRPYFLDGLTRILSCMVAHECRNIGF